jgi:HD-GYP domain-containing protein (c-di-GMP phosphodiesterase class II)
MPEKRKKISIPKILLLPDGNSVNKNYINIILKDEIPVLCMNRNSGKERLMPFKVLYDNNENFWRQDNNWDYYLLEDDLEKLKEKAAVQPKKWEVEIPKTDKSSAGETDKESEEESKVEFGFGDEYSTFTKMTAEEKIGYLNESKTKLNDLITQKNKDTKVITETLVDTAKDAALINYVALEEAMHLADDEAKKFTKEFVVATNEMVKASAQLSSDDLMNDNLMNDLVKKSNGTIVQHMTRVYLKGISFLSYYNNLVSTSSIIQKIRISFSAQYQKLYHSLLTHIHPDDIDLERVFLGGMRAVSPDLFNKWATGFLIHDIGKASAVEYHEGETKYDRQIVIDHVKTGYKSVMSKTNFPIEATLITGYHHEYYGHSDGYGYFRAALQQHKKQNPDAKQDYCITYEHKSILEYRALAYFPAKILEIVDIYDSVTDPNRIYRKALSPEEAIIMMREQFIVTHLKIDPILFDIFSGYIQEKQDSKQTS